MISHGETESVKVSNGVKGDSQREAMSEGRSAGGRRETEGRSLLVDCPVTHLVAVDGAVWWGGA